MPNEVASGPSRTDKILKAFIFGAIWFGFASTMVARKPFGIVKTSIQESFNVTEDMLSLLDIGFALPYSVASLLCSSLGDYFPPYLVLSGGLMGTALATLPMSAVQQYYQLIVLVFLSGTFQSLAWPTSCSIISKHFTGPYQTTIFGAFSTSSIIGSVAGSLLAVYFEEEFGWHLTFIMPAILLASGGLLVLGTCYATNKSWKDANSKEAVKQNKGLSPLACLRLPGVIGLSLSLFCVKAVKNAALFWLPMFLTRSLGYPNAVAGLLAISCEIGALVGSVTVPLFIDKFFPKQDIAVTIVSSLMSGISFILLSLSKGFPMTVHILLLASAGVFATASEVILGGSAPSRIGKRHQSESSINGFINGVGSFGGIAEGVLIALIMKWVGNMSIVYVMTVFCIFASICSTRAAFVERRQAKLS